MAKILKWVAIALVVVFASSWIAGQVRGCFGPKPPKEVPAKVDPGAPIAGPIAQAPTFEACLPVAVPDLTREEILAYARRYGLALAEKPPAPRPQPGQGAPPGEGGPNPAPSDGRPTEARLSEPYPFGEERFTHEASGVAADCSAWFMGEGERIDLRCIWLPWKPPVPAIDPGYFGNVARFEKGFLLGYVGMKLGEETVASPGLGFSLRYRGWEVGKATIDAGVLGLVTFEGDGAVMGGVGASW